MGIVAYIYKEKGLSFSNGGASSKYDKLTLVNVGGPFDPSEDAPAALLLPNALGSAKVVMAVKQGNAWVPYKPASGVGPMFGGTYVASSDSRFSEGVADILGRGFYGAVPLHDRYESQELSDILDR